MTAATEARRTAEREGAFTAGKVAAGATIHSGTIVAYNATGYVVPASKTAGLTCAGLAAESAANTKAGNADGDLTIRVQREGTFLWAKAAGLTIADAGKKAYAEDDQTVGVTAGGNAVRIGRVVEVTDAGVWVEFTYED